jgi:anti-anti-sigma factor
MQLQCLAPTDVDDESLHVRTVGRIAPDSGESDHDILTEMLGPDIYHRRVVLNLGDSEFISSSGIGWLLQLHKRFERSGGKLVLQNVPREIEQIFRVMRLHTLLHFN